MFFILPETLDLKSQLDKDWEIIWHGTITEQNELFCRTMKQAMIGIVITLVLSLLRKNNDQTKTQ